MLVLTRKQGERFVIGNDILVTVVSVKGNKVRIGISAPEDVSILREELIIPATMNSVGPSIEEKV